MAAPEYEVLDAWYKWLIGNVKIESDLISKYKVICFFFFFFEQKYIFSFVLQFT